MVHLRLITALLILILATPAMAVVLTPAQPAYEVGDMLTFTVLNDGAVTIHFPTIDPLRMSNLDTGEGFTFVGVPVISDLNPGASTEFSISSAVLTPGTYNAILEYYIDVPNEFTTTTTVILNVKVDAPSDSMGDLKSRFRD